MKGGTTLNGVGHGTLLAGRYRLEARVRTGADGSLWRAVDETLDRQVSVRVVRPGHRYTADVVDAARRAALVEDARLIRVLDVGESGGSAYIVSEHLAGRSLAELLAAGPIPAETARRLVGEAAEALERASARGLHHLQLTPDSLVIAPDGGVKVLGTAVEAALAGVEHDEDPVGADRADAVGLVRVLYAGLTGRWPGAVDGPLDTAPKVTGRSVPPGDLVAGVPNDLDTLCSVTLGPHDDGPQSPGELAEQLAPWAQTDPLTDPRGLAVAGPSRPAPDSVEALAAQAAAGRLPSSGSVPASAPATAPGKPTSAPATAPGKPATPTHGLDLAAPESAGAAAGTTARMMRHATPARGVTAPAEPGLPTLLPAGTAEGAGGTTSRTSGAAGAGEGNSGPRPSSPGSASGPGSPGGWAEDAQPDDWAMLSRPTPAPRRTPDPDSEPLGPFIPPAPISRPPQDQTRFVLGVVAALVVLGLIFAVFSLRGLFGSADPLVQPEPLIPATPSTRSAAAPPPSAPSAPATPASAAPSVSPAASGAASVSPSPSPSGTPGEVSGIQAIDPQGDGDENGGTADRAIDGDTLTNWRSARYQTASFGGLKKGLGLYLHVSGGQIKSVTVEMEGRGGAVELRTADGPGLDSSVVVATAGASGGKAVLTPATPLPRGPLLLWFTELPQQDSGEYRLVVSEITVS